MYTYVCMYVYVYVYTYIYIYIHTHVYPPRFTWAEAGNLHREKVHACTRDVYHIVDVLHNLKCDMYYMHVCWYACHTSIHTNRQTERCLIARLPPLFRCLPLCGGVRCRRQVV